MIDPVERYCDIADRGHRTLTGIPGFGTVIEFVLSAVLLIVAIPILFPFFIVGFIAGGLSKKP